MCIIQHIRAAPSLATVMKSSLYALEHTQDKSDMKRAFKSCMTTLDGVLDRHHKLESNEIEETKQAYLQGLHSFCTSARKSDVNKFGRVMREWEANYPDDFREEPRMSGQ